MAVVFLFQGHVCWRATRDEELRTPIPPSATQIIRFDERANPSLLPDIRQQTPLYSLVSGQLRKNGVAVTIAPSPPRSAFRDREAVAALAAKCRSPVAVLDQDDMKLIGRLLLRLLREMDN